MKLKVLSMVLSIMLMSAILSGCATTDNNGTRDLENELVVQEERISGLEKELEALTVENEGLKIQLSDLQLEIDSEQPDSILYEAILVMELLKDQDMVGLAPHIHPTKGVRFSPYSYIDLQDDLVFTSQELVSLLQSNQSYTWGVYDGSGEPIEATFSEYYNRFIYDEDYANPHMIGNNVVVGTGNTIVNIDQTYPDGLFVEFHYTGFDPQYAGMDWRSLRLVFEEYNGIWYLVGIVHDEWTI